MCWFAGALVTWFDCFSYFFKVFVCQFVKYVVGLFVRVLVCSFNSFVRPVVC